MSSFIKNQFLIWGNVQPLFKRKLRELNIISQELFQSRIKAVFGELSVKPLGATDKVTIEISLENDKQCGDHSVKFSSVAPELNPATKMNGSHQVNLNENAKENKLYPMFNPLQAHEEYQYLGHIKRILETGIRKDDRTGVGTYSIFGAQMRYTLTNNTMPLFTTKRVFWRGVAEELLWFIRGSTNANELKAKKINIWNENSSKEFLSSIGLGHREEGDLGPVYGFQWRHFGAKYEDMHSDYTGQGVDQLQNVINTIKNNPNDRRIIMSAWNPMDLSAMALPPCHCLVQFFVANGKLSCMLYQRSADMGLGVPFNVASYALLTHMIAHVCGLEAGEFVHTLGDSHVYTNHVEALQEQLTRSPTDFPKLHFNRKVDSIEDFTFEDFRLENYNPHKAIPMPMAV